LTAEALAAELVEGEEVGERPAASDEVELGEPVPVWEAELVGVPEPVGEGVVEGRFTLTTLNGDCKCGGSGWEQGRREAGGASGSETPL